MTAKYEVENLLRAPYELISASCLAVSSLFCVVAPHLLLMSPVVGYGFAALFFGYGSKRAWEGYTVLRYQKHLKRLPRYTLSPEQLPITATGQFLGRGFEWKSKHTERMIATLDARNEKYVRRSYLYQVVRRLEFKLEENKLFFLRNMLQSDTVFNPFRPDPPVGGRSELHGVGMAEEHDCFMKMSDREGHLVVVGATGVGKTRAAEIFITQDIHRSKENVVVVIDPKGDADLFKRVYCESKKAGRLGQLRVLHLAFAEMSAKYNPIGSFSRITEIPTRLTGNLPDSGDAKSFKDFSWQFTKFVGLAEVNLGDKPTYKSIKRHLRNIDSLFKRYAHHVLTGLNFPYQADLREKLAELSQSQKGLKGRDVEAVALSQLIKDQEIYDPVLADLQYMFELDREYYNKIVIQIGPFLEKVTTGRIGEILSPNYDDTEDERKTLDFLELFKQGGVVYIGLDALTDPEIASAVGEAAFSELTSLAGYMYNYGIDSENPYENIPHRNVHIHGDEFSDLVGPKFTSMINKTRGVGYQLSLYTQTLSDILAKVESEARAGQIIGNINNIYMMRPQEYKTAQILTDKLPEVKVRDRIMVSGHQDQADSIRYLSSNQDRTTETRVPLLSPSDVMSLPKGQAFCLTDGNRLFKLRTPMIKDAKDSLPTDIQTVIREMKSHYSNQVNWADLTKNWMA